MIDIFLNRKNFSYNIPEFDKLLRTEELPQSFILYQEQLMKALNYAGFDMSECYQMIKAIAKKKQGIVEPLKERFIKGFCDKGNQINDANKVWKIIEDAVGYGFNSSHALSVALDSVYGAYLKAYYPLEFYTTMIEIYTEKKDKDKLSSIKQEMKCFGIKENDLIFGENNSKIIFDKERNIITSLLASVKGINSKIANELYLLSKNKYNDFYSLYKDIVENCSLNSAQRETLVKLNYFKNFAESKKILKFIDYYNLLENKKQIKKEKVDDIILCSFNDYSETPMNYNKFDYNLTLKNIWNGLNNESLEVLEIIKFQLDYLGYLTIEIPKDIAIIKVNMVSAKTDWIKGISFRDNVEKWFKVKTKPKKDDILFFYMKDIKLEKQQFKKDAIWITDYKIIK